MSEKLKKPLYFFIILIELLCFLSTPIVFAAENDLHYGRIIYFSSPTCSSCNDIDKYINTIVGLEVTKYNIIEKEDKYLFDYFCDIYNVPEDSRTVPLVFAGEVWIMGKDNISKNLLGYLNETKNYEYPKPESNSNNHINDIRLIYSRNLLTILFTGIINGLNPCSLAMIVFLITLIATKSKKKVLLMSLSFIISKFLSFLLLGTILFKALNYINIGKMQLYLKIIMIFFIAILIIGNSFDYINARKGKFKKLKLQLPQKVRKFNQSLMKTIKRFDDIKLICIIIFLIGILISVTEFLCTGQIYLVSIVTIFQYVQGEMIKALTYLLVYNLGLVLPLLVLAFVIYKGKNILDVSQKIVERIHYIKIMNIILLAIIFVFIIIYM